MVSVSSLSAELFAENWELTLAAFLSVVVSREMFKKASATLADD